jgi:hypothetical protein
LILAWLACNQAPVTFPGDAWAPDGAAPWYHPSDIACDRMFPDEEIVVLDGYRYCGVSQALGHIVPVDDPVYRPCSEAHDEGHDVDLEVLSLFDGARARAYLLEEMVHREIVHTDWDGGPVIVNYCPVIAGGDVLRRQIDGEPLRYNIVGMWGSANTVAPRRELFGPGSDYTVYTTWDGHALRGPGRPGALEKLPVLIDYIPLDEFVTRYGSLGETCEIWVGDEELGVGCEEACTRYRDLCPDADVQQCQRECSEIPRAINDCMVAAQTCDEQRVCQQVQFSRQ